MEKRQAKAKVIRDIRVSSNEKNWRIPPIDNSTKAIRSRTLASSALRFKRVPTSPGLATQHPPSLLLGKHRTYSQSDSLTIQKVSRPPVTSLSEVDILREVVVRESVLNELQSCLTEPFQLELALSLIKVLRSHTLSLVENISAWQAPQTVPRPFLYHGLNYMNKIADDSSFLADHQAVVETLGFDVTDNPLLYPGGGLHLVVDDQIPIDTYLTTAHNWEGIELHRLRNAEKVICFELNRSYSPHIDLGTDEITPFKFNMKRTVLEKIAVTEDSKRYWKTNLKSLSSQVDRKFEALHSLNHSRNSLGRSLHSNRLTPAQHQHVRVQLSVVSADIQKVNADINELNRQISLLKHESAANTRVAVRLQGTLDDVDRKKKLTVQVNKKLSTQGLADSLKYFLHQVDRFSLASEESFQVDEVFIPVKSSQGTRPRPAAQNSSRNFESKVIYLDDLEQSGDGSKHSIENQSGTAPSEDSLRGDPCNTIDSSNEINSSWAVSHSDEVDTEGDRVDAGKGSDEKVEQVSNERAWDERSIVDEDSDEIKVYNMNENFEESANRIEGILLGDYLSEGGGGGQSVSENVIQEPSVSQSVMSTSGSDGSVRGSKGIERVVGEVGDSENESAIQGAIVSESVISGCEEGDGEDESAIQDSVISGSEEGDVESESVIDEAGQSGSEGSGVERDSIVKGTAGSECVGSESGSDCVGGDSGSEGVGVVGNASETGGYGVVASEE